MSYLNSTEATDFRKKVRISDFNKILPAGAEFHADERTNMMKLIVVFRNFANALKNWSLKYRVAHKSFDTEGNT
jgi:hypothetical protein